MVKLFDLFGTCTLRHRETARKVVETLNKTSSDELVIDFDKIDFASHSFLHELLSDLGNRNVIFKNRNVGVEKMMDIAQRRVCLCVTRPLTLKCGRRNAMRRNTNYDQERRGQKK